MVFHQEKVVFTWEEPRPRLAIPTRLRFRSVAPETLDTFTGTIARALQGSLDAYDRERSARIGVRDTAACYTRPDPKYFSYEIEWWQLAYNADESVVGFTQPVVFAGCARAGLEEATIHYIGVVPEHRGRGYIVDLLSAATRPMQELGVWRILCDTDTENRPMMEAFRRVGYEPGEIRIVTHEL